MELMRLVYVSQPFGYDDLALSGILASARRNNRRDEITGALLCREDLYLQMLEGPPAEVMRIYGRIQHDERHANVVTLLSEKTDARLFPEWAMRHDPAKSWMWTIEQVASGAVARAAPAEIRAVFTRLASEPPSVDQTCPVHVVNGAG